MPSCCNLLLHRHDLLQKSFCESSALFLEVKRLDCILPGVCTLMPSCFLFYCTSLFFLIFFLTCCCTFAVVLEKNLHKLAALDFRRFSVITSLHTGDKHQVTVDFLPKDTSQLERIPWVGPCRFLVIFCDSLRWTPLIPFISSGIRSIGQALKNTVFEKNQRFFNESKKKMTVEQQGPTLGARFKGGSIERSSTWTFLSKT